MKHTLKLVALTLVLLMSVAMLAACSAPNADPEKAVDALEDKGYTAAEDTLIIPNALKLLGVKDVKSVISGTKIDSENEKVEHITVVYFEDSEAADAAWDKVKKYAEDDKEDDDSDWTIDKSGAMIFWGTKTAVKDAR